MPPCRSSDARSALRSRRSSSAERLTSAQYSGAICAEWSRLLRCVFQSHETGHVVRTSVRPTRSEGDPARISALHARRTSAVTSSPSVAHRRNETDWHASQTGPDQTRRLPPSTPTASCAEIPPASINALRHPSAPITADTSGTVSPNGTEPSSEPIASKRASARRIRPSRSSPIASRASRCPRSITVANVALSVARSGVGTVPSDVSSVGND